MYFFERNEEYQDRIFCIEESGASYTYRQVWEIGDTIISRIPRRSLVLLQAGNDVNSVSAYLALLRKRCPVILMGKHGDQQHVEGMIRTYRPHFIISDGKVSTGAEPDAPGSIRGDLALLLSTSGSTGAQKLVRLSYENLQANCSSIVQYLELTADERPITTLPMEYTYGLSVIHSHAAVGASIILTDRTMFEPQFWEMAEQQKATSMAGVPYTYEMLERLRFRRMQLPALKTMTQAGGHLKPELQEKMAQWAEETGRRFFVMYGQTEATARMSYIPWERCGEKIGSIGIPVPGGRIELQDEDGRVIREPGEKGELIYYGPNVSMGYAVCREDLAKGDETEGRLETGDIAFADEEGYFFIAGRKKRFVKLYGKRMSLDQIQEDLQEDFPEMEMVCTGNDAKGITVWIAGLQASGAGSAQEDETEEAMYQVFQERWGIRENMVHIEFIEAIPRNSSGKVVYAQLESRPQKQG